MIRRDEKSPRIPTICGKKKEYDVNNARVAETLRRKKKNNVQQ
jgi:hypothetical protein